MSIASEIASIDGFDEDTASEIQARAREYLDRIEAEHDAKRKELGVADELREIPGITTAMLVTLGEDGVKTVEDFAGYAVDDLVGWKERKDGETKFFPGVLANHSVSRDEAEQMVMAARLKAGWITEDDIAAGQERKKKQSRKQPVRDVRTIPAGVALGRNERAHMHRHAQERRAG